MLNNNPQNKKNKNEQVKKSYTDTIRNRIDTLLLERGLKWADIYNQLGWFKSFASLVHNGKIIPPLWQRVALAKELGVDSSVIWKISDLIPANKNEEGENEKNNFNSHWQ